MLLSRKTLVTTLVIVLAATVLGCSGGPTPITVPSIQVEEAADAAFSQYDKDGDGQKRGGIVGMPRVSGRNGI